MLAKYALGMAMVGLAASPFLAKGASAQAAPLRGAVVDQAGEAVRGADVIVYREGATVAHLQTDGSGAFSFDAPAREYSVLIRAPGFAPLRSSSLPFKTGSRTTFTLSVTSAASASDDVGVASSGEVPKVATVSPEPHGARRDSWEYGVLAQGGIGTADRSDYRFFSLGGHAGRVLTPDLGSGLLKGTFEYSVEVFPLWQSYTPRFQKISCTPLTGTTELYRCSQPYTVGGTFTGVSITPIQLRWNFTHGQHLRPWVQGAGGVIWTDHKYPAIGNTNPADYASNGPSGDTSVWNFTPQFGVGAHYFVRPRRSIDLSANAVHISSASLGDKNPGVNASVQFTLGYTWWK